MVPEALNYHAPGQTVTQLMSVRPRSATNTHRRSTKHPASPLLPNASRQPLYVRRPLVAARVPSPLAAPLLRRGRCSQCGPSPRLRCNHGVCAVNKQDWHAISRFESYDLVKAWYKETHGREPNNAKDLTSQRLLLTRTGILSERSLCRLERQAAVTILWRVVLISRCHPTERSIKEGRIAQPTTRSAGCRLARISERGNQGCPRITGQVYKRNFP